MPYLSKDTTKNVRQALKKEFGKDIKFSVTTRHHSELVVSIMESKEDFSDVVKDRGYVQLNHFYLGEYNHPTLEKIAEIITTTSDHKSKVFEDSDYGNIPSFYISMNIGKWDKPWKLIEKEA